MIEVLGVSLGLLAGALGMIWNGYALTVLWAWFITPTFGLQPLSVAAAIGVAIVARYVTSNKVPDTPNEEKDAQEKAKDFAFAVLWQLMKPAMALALGWVVKQWM